MAPVPQLVPVIVLPAVRVTVAVLLEGPGRVSGLKFFRGGMKNVEVCEDVCARCCPGDAQQHLGDGFRWSQRWWLLCPRLCHLRSTGPGRVRRSGLCDLRAGLRHLLQAEVPQTTLPPLALLWLTQHFQRAEIKEAASEDAGGFLYFLRATLAWATSGTATASNPTSGSPPVAAATRSPRHLDK